MCGNVGDYIRLNVGLCCHFYLKPVSTMMIGCVAVSLARHLNCLVMLLLTPVITMMAVCIAVSLTRHLNCLVILLHLTVITMLAAGMAVGWTRHLNCLVGLLHLSDGMTQFIVWELHDNGFIRRKLQSNVIPF